MISFSSIRGFDLAQIILSQCRRTQNVFDPNICKVQTQMNANISDKNAILIVIQKNSNRTTFQNQVQSLMGAFEISLLFFGRARYNCYTESQICSDFFV